MSEPKPIAELKETVEIPKIEGELITLAHPHMVKVLQEVRAHIGAKVIKASECLIYCTDVSMQASHHEIDYTVVFQRVVDRHEDGMQYMTTILDHVRYREWIEWPDGLEGEPIIKTDFNSLGEFDVLGQECLGRIPAPEPIASVEAKKATLILD